MAQTSESKSPIYARILEDWGLTDEEKDRLTNCALGDTGVEKDIRTLVILIHFQLRNVFSSPLNTEWVKRPNTGPLFNGKSPLEAMCEGGLPVLRMTFSHLKTFRGSVTRLPDVG